MSIKPFKQWWNDYLNFSKKDRRAVLVLSVLIILVLAMHLIVGIIFDSPQLNQDKARQAITEWEKLKNNQTKKYTYFPFNPNTILENKLDSLALPEFVKRNIINYRNAGGTFKNSGDLRKIYGMNDSIFLLIEDYLIFPEIENQGKVYSSKSIDTAPKNRKGNFDPNTASYDTLLLFGLNKYQAGNIIKYRNNGGSFRKPGDLIKIYGIDSAFFNEIENHILINRQAVNANEKQVAAPVLLELNSADAGKLEKLSGIGPVFAKRIIKFRDLLGGYHSKKQLLEVYNLPEETYSKIEPMVFTDSTRIKKIRLNFAGYADLLRHPYLGKEDVKRIIDFREKNGAFSSPSELLKNEVLNKEEFEKIEPYLSCQ